MADQEFILKTELRQFISKLEHPVFRNQECHKFIYKFMTINNVPVSLINNVPVFVNRELNQLKNQGVLYQSKDWRGKYFYVKKRYVRPNINKINFKIKNFTNDDINIICDILNHQSEEDIQKRIRQESFSTSIIEGSSLDESNYFLRKNDKKDIEVLEHKNLIKTINWLNQNDFKMNQSFLKKLHYEMFDNIVGTYRNQSQIAGEFKKRINFFKTGFLCCLPENVEQELKAFVNFYNKTPLNVKDAFVKVGFLHVWFETIHPFPDGNGRIGRTLINHYLKQHKFLKNMNLDISDLILKNRDSYVHNLKSADPWDNFANFVDWFTKTVNEYKILLIRNKEKELENDYEQER